MHRANLLLEKRRPQKKETDKEGFHKHRLYSKSLLFLVARTVGRCRASKFKKIVKTKKKNFTTSVFDEFFILSVTTC